MTGFRLTGVTVISPGNSIRKQAVVTVDPPTIRSVRDWEDESHPGPDAPPATATIDLAGKFCVPGLIDAHLHLQLDGGADPVQALLAESPWTSGARSRKRAQAALRAGITTIRDCGARDAQILQLRDAIDAGRLVGPRIVACGQPITAPAGHMSAVGHQAVGRDGFTRAVHEQISAGADFIKVIASSGASGPADAPVASEIELAAAVEAAHAAGRRVTAHAYGLRGIRKAMRAGVDSIEHCTNVDPELLAAIAGTGTLVVPTLMNTYCQSALGCDTLPTRVSADAGRVHRDAEAAFAELHAAGLPLACGTDGGAWLNPHDDVVTELELRVRLGASPSDALRMATLDAAEVCGIPNIGQVEPGRRADLLILSRDPLLDIRNLRSVEMVIKDGRIVEDRRSFAEQSSWA